MAAGRTKRHDDGAEPRRRHRLASGRRDLIAGAAFAAVLLSAGAVATVRELANWHGRGARSVAASHVGTNGASDRAGQARGRPATVPASAAPSGPAPALSPPAGDCTRPQFATSKPTAGWSDGTYYLDNNMWNAGRYSVTQTLYACSYRNWFVVADMNNGRGDGVVKTYPDVQRTFSEPAISSFRSISSTFAETGPGTGIYEDAYDIWINGVARPGSTEIMIWTNTVHQVPSGSVRASATIGGRAFQVWRSGHYIAFVAEVNFSAGTLNLLQFLDWVMARGWIAGRSTLGQIDYGAEMVSTGNVPATFSFTNFSIKTS